jgi:translation elongation factor EF-Tu-like GTPase
MPLPNLKSGSRVAGMLALLLFSLSFSANAVADNGFSMKIMDVFAIAGRGTVLTGQVATGSVTVGDTVCVPLQNGETAALGVDGIEMFRKVLERAEQGQMVGILVHVDKKQVEKGALLHGDCEAGDVAEQMLNPTGM